MFSATVAEPLNAALAFAARAHQNQRRKGSDIPYIVHPVGVMLVLLEADETDLDLLRAALLHDTLEDTATSLADLEAHFGPRVASIVQGCTEPYERTAAWETRKEHTVAYLREAPRDILLVAAADKLHNLRSLEADYMVLGEALWSRFHRGRDSTAWYYRAVTASLKASVIGPHLIVQRLAETVGRFFGPVVV